MVDMGIYASETMLQDTLLMYKLFLIADLMYAVLSLFPVLDMIVSKSSIIYFWEDLFTDAF